jgi:iron-sulfur cluster assembly accessory protein
MSLLTITNMAKNHLFRIVSESNNKYLLFSAVGGGCNGFNYKLEPTNKLIDGKDIVSLENNKKENLLIELCPKSLMYIIGTKIDWKEDMMGSCFTFENPNATSKCGCGTSFDI